VNSFIAYSRSCNATPRAIFFALVPRQPSSVNPAGPWADRGALASIRGEAAAPSKEPVRGHATRRTFRAAFCLEKMWHGRT